MKKRPQFDWLSLYSMCAIYFARFMLVAAPLLTLWLFLPAKWHGGDSFWLGLLSVYVLDLPLVIWGYDCLQELKAPPINGREGHFRAATAIFALLLGWPIGQIVALIVHGPGPNMRPPTPEDEKERALREEIAQDEDDLSRLRGRMFGIGPYSYLYDDLF